MTLSWWRRGWRWWLAALVVVAAAGGALGLEWFASLTALTVAAWLVAALFRARLGLRPLAAATAAVVAVLILAQLVPYGRNHTNPPVIAEPSWNSPTTRALAVRACFDCHSNETSWPWYTNVAPASWVTQNHVDEGRERLNYSEFGSGHFEADDSAEVVREGEMPLRDYTLVHPAARLTAAEKQQLIDGLTATFGR
jgi:hypothetical protein